MLLAFAALPPAEAASSKTLQLSQAQNMALSNNEEINKTYNQILLKQSPVHRSRGRHPGQG